MLFYQPFRIKENLAMKKNKKKEQTTNTNITIRTVTPTGGVSVKEASPKAAKLFERRVQAALVVHGD